MVCKKVVFGSSIQPKSLNVGDHGTRKTRFKSLCMGKEVGTKCKAMNLKRGLTLELLGQLLQDRLLEKMKQTTFEEED